MERLLLTFTQDGALRGISQYGWDGMPSALNAGMLATVLPDINAASLARIAELEAELQEAKTGPQPAVPNDLVATTISALHRVFSAAVPGDNQASFAIPYAIVRVLIQAEQWQLARDVIAGIAVPPELEAVKLELIAVIP